MIGPVEMVLYAASSAKDTDFIVRLSDVYPNGKVDLRHRGHPPRALPRQRDEGDSIELLEPNEVAEYRIRCYPMANVFRRGHRLRLDVTSSSFPRFSRNLNTGEDVGTGTRMEVARQTRPAHERLSVARRAARRSGDERAALFDLSGRTALVTGSTRGLGLALARALAGAGARVAINGRSGRRRAAVEAFAADGLGAVAAPFDVTDEEAVAAGVERARRRSTCSSTTPGMTLRKPLEQWSLAEWRAHLRR